MQNNNTHIYEGLLLSNHAILRGQQRAISINITDLVLQYGEPVKKPGKAVEIKISKKTKQTLFCELKKQQKLLEKASSIAVLVSDDGEIITQYHLKDWGIK